MNILDKLSPDAIKVPLESTDKRSAINELIDVLATNGHVGDAPELKRVVWEREQQRSTGIGEGLAIPHGKSDASEDLLIAVGHPSAPIDFEAIDGKPVQLIVLLISPPDKTAEHIQALGKISRMMADPTTREAAYACPSAEALYELFRQHETNQSAPA